MADSHPTRIPGLPRETTSFVGRRREVAEIQRLCRKSRLVTVTGVGGVGKTRVTLQAVQDLAAATATSTFADGVRWVELSALTDGDLLGHTIAKALHLTDQTARSQIEVLTDHLADKRLLLVLDTCEHLVESCSALVGVLLRSAPHLHILATSRQPLGVEHELTLTIPPLPLPDLDSSLTPDLVPGLDWAYGGAFGEEGAVRLFVERAAQADPQLVMDEPWWRAVAELCRHLEGIPLAIELAAGWLSEMPLEQVVAQQEDRFALLVNGTGPLSRHHTLRTTVGWSHELCSRPQRLLWARLSVFAGEFDLDAVRHVCRDEHLPEEALPELLGALVDRSILLRRPSGTTVRYRLLDTLRQYGAEWLRELGEQDHLRRRHRNWYLRMARHGETQWFGPGQAAVFARIQREHSNLQAALEFSLTTPGEARTGLRLAAALWFYWVGCGHLGEGRHWLDRALAAVPEQTSERAKGLWVNGYIAVLQGDSSAAVLMLSACHQQAVETGDRRARAYAVHRLGCAALLNDDHAHALPRFEEALTLYQELDELNSNVIMAQVELAMTVAFQGELATAVQLCEQVREICEDHGERWAKSYALYVLAFAAWTRGQVAEATTLAREALRINYAFHDLIGIVLPIELLALFLTEDRREPGHQAAVLQGAAHQIWRSVGPPLFGSVYFNAPHATCQDRLRRTLGDHAYEAAFRTGTQLSLSETVRHALGEAQLPQPRTISF